ncbi:MAG: dihydrodipicolinate synthase family protein, partial [Chloroflexota bacterium]|nr:dihydrodipicolinate synthase family protein [Chloroflexota bacterium]
MTDTSFRGLFPILAMPFDENGNVDEDDLRKEVEFCISTGADGLGLAMASEMPKLSEDERNSAAKIVVEQSSGRAKVVINTSAT